MIITASFKLGFHVVESFVNKSFSTMLNNVDLHRLEFYCMLVSLKLTKIYIDNLLHQSARRGHVIFD